MIPRGLVWLVICLVVQCSGQLIFPKQVSREPRVNQNEVIQLDTSCDRDSLSVVISMQRAFKGVIFAKDFSRECSALGNLETSVSLHLPASGCGVRVTRDYHKQNDNTSEFTDDIFQDDGLVYTVTVVIQMDKHLQQSSDQERQVRCWLKPSAMQITSPALQQIITNNINTIAEKQSYTNGAHRSGRMGGEWRDIPEDQRATVMEAARAWMEIGPGEESDQQQVTVEVGQPTLLTIKSTLPAGVGVRITECLAHDGIGETSQKLLDERGCPIDELIFPRMSVTEQRSNTFDSDNTEETMLKNIMTYQQATTIFSAFKFPDRARLHVSCGVELCRGPCPQHPCHLEEQIETDLILPKSKNPALLRKTRLDEDVIIDRLQVYNSIEVIAPNIELDDEVSVRGSKNDYDIFFASSSIKDKTVCMSPSKMALTFCILGLIFLSALVVAFISLIRARRNYGSDRFGPFSLYNSSKSLFSGSGSSNSGFSGSKLLLTDSPYMEHQSTSSNNWPYGRVF